MASYLVTGGCGFIGSHLVEELLDEGHYVRVLDDLSTGQPNNCPPRAELVVGDVADAGLTRRAMDGMDGCYHLAAVASVQRSIADWIGAHRTNLTGTIAVLDAARSDGEKPAKPVVFASSAAVYGASSALPLQENTSVAPISAYGADKLGSELHGAVAAHMFNIPVTGLRFFNVFGPRQDPNSQYSGVISIFIKRILGGNSITIFGSGTQTRDFIYVDDVTAALRVAMRKSERKFSVYNVCTGVGTSLIEIASALMELTGNDVPVLYEDARPGDIRDSRGDAGCMNKILGVTAKTSVIDGLKLTLLA